MSVLLRILLADGRYLSNNDLGCNFVGSYRVTGTEQWRKSWEDLKGWQIVAVRYGVNGAISGLGSYFITYPNGVPTLEHYPTKRFQQDSLFHVFVK